MHLPPTMMTKKSKLSVKALSKQYQQCHYNIISGYLNAKVCLELDENELPLQNYGSDGFVLCLFLTDEKANKFVFRTKFIAYE